MRVLIGRAQAQAEASARRLALRGHAGIVAPLTRIVPVSPPRPREPVDALVVTSAHAGPAGASLRAALGSIPVFAVGAQSAAALAAAGFGDVRAGAGDAAELAVMVAASLPSGARILHLAGRDRRPEPETSLRAAGFVLTVAEVYRAEPVARLPEAARRGLADGTVDAALHYSARGAGLLLTLAAEAGLGPALRRIVHVCLSTQVAEACADIPGRGRIVAAARPDEEALFEALDGTRPDG